MCKYRLKINLIKAQNICVKFSIILILLLCEELCLKAQTIQLYFPHFGGSEYVFSLIQGDKNDTIRQGNMEADGRLTLTIPEKYKQYTGMGQWILKGGGGLSFVVNGEDFSISSEARIPSDETIFYTGSPENSFLNQYLKKQQTILAKIDAMQMAMQAYKSSSNPIREEESGKSAKELLSVFQKELDRQQQAYNQLKDKATASSLHAAGLAQVTDISRGLPQTMPSTPEETAKQFRDFVLNKLDMHVLYTSGHWSAVLSRFINLYTINERNASLFIPDIIQLLHRIKSEEVYTALVEKAIMACEKQNWNDSEMQLAFFLLNDNRIGTPSGKVSKLYALFKLKNGAKAPALTQGILPKGKTLLVFYETGCGNCLIQLDKLTEEYPNLKKKGYQVVSVSADVDKELFETSAQKYPWNAKYCNFKGFDGDDFKNYGVIGTPTFYLIDENGMIQGRYARLADTGLL